ncbi:unnamed protein product, partial [Closterium sp. Yama58-4]
VEPSKKDHTLPVLPPFTVQNDTPDTLTMRRMDRMLHPFAMPPEDFPPPVQPQGFSGLFLKGTVFERIPWKGGVGGSGGRGAEEGALVSAVGGEGEAAVGGAVEGAGGAVEGVGGAVEGAGGAVEGGCRQ